MPLIRHRKRRRTTKVVCSKGKRTTVTSYPLKPTTRHTDGDGDVVFNHIHSSVTRQATDETFTILASVSDATTVTNPNSTTTSSITDEAYPGSTKYATNKKERLSEWKEKRASLHEAYISGEYAMNDQCSSCLSIVSPRFRCIDCAQWEILCHDCLTARHSHPHLHIFEEWKNEAYIYVDVETPTWIFNHDCTSTYTKNMVVVDDRGRQLKRIIQFCACESEAERLVRFKLWPSTTRHPTVALSFELMDWMHGLMNEGHVSLKAFCEALKARSSKYSKSNINLEIKDIYKVLLTETFEEYRHFLYLKEHPFEDNGTECPCCYLASRKIYSLDADFQLVRKASAGKTWDEPKHAGHFFCDQNDVDNFLLNYKGDSSKPDIDCSDFQAGSSIRAKSKNAKLSETALFGSTCRHAYPKFFFSLRHGERLGYAVYLIKKLMEENTENKKMYILYDIACSLKSHLKKQNENDILNEIIFAIPIFHAYGHKVPCQVQFGPRRIEGLGLTDGESVERLWSYLGCFANITKETSPENRIDILTNGLLHYGMKLRDKIAGYLTKSLEKCQELEESSLKAFDETLVHLEGVTSRTVESWIQKETKEYECLQNHKKGQLTEKEEYALAIKKLSEMNEDEYKLKSVKRTINRIEKNIGIHWQLNDDQFLMHLRLAQSKERESLLNMLQNLVNERAFLLDLIKKYARGQAVAQRLSKQVKNCNKKIRQILKQYNNGNNDSLTFDDIKDTDANIWKRNPEPNQSDFISQSIKNQLINLKLVIMRSKEECELIKEEMKSAIAFYKHQHCKLLEIYSCSLRGKRAISVKEGLLVELCLLDLINKFAPYIGILAIPIDFRNIIGLITPVPWLEEFSESSESEIEESDED